MNIPNIKPDLPTLEQVSKEFGEILSNGKITNFGKYVTMFEELAGSYLGTHTATISSGTMGLLFALQSVGVKPGQKVIIPSFTFMATAQAVLYAGGIPLFAEIDDDFNLCTEDLKQLLATHDNIGCVIPVHMYGLPCKTEMIESIVKTEAQKRGIEIPVIYDAAHAFGSLKNNQKVGRDGTAEVFSLSVTKILVSVEGGLVSSQDKVLIDRIKKMRGYGIESNYNTCWPGLNGKMSEFHAIVGIESLKNLEANLAQRQRQAAYYSDLIKKQTSFGLQPIPGNVRHTFKDFTIVLPDSLIEKRDLIMNELKERGVETRAYFYPPVHEQTYFKKYADRTMPRTELLARKVITLPFFTSITKEQVDYIVEALIATERKVS